MHEPTWSWTNDIHCEARVWGAHGEYVLSARRINEPGWPGGPWSWMAQHRHGPGKAVVASGRAHFLADAREDAYLSIGPLRRI